MSRSRSSSSGGPSTELYVYADSICLPRERNHLGAYGVFCPLHSIRISEPLPGPKQTEGRAELASLLSAMELVHGTRARSAIIYSASPAVVNSYINHLQSWATRSWRTTNGRHVKNHRLWREIWHHRDVFLDRGVDLEVECKGRNSDHNMRTAHRLARNGVNLHVTCELCKKTHGRQWGDHSCEPICSLDECEDRKFKDVASYMRHLRRRHLKACRHPDCPERFSTFFQAELDAHEEKVHGGRVFRCNYCGQYFKSERKLKRHIRSTCSKAPWCNECGRLFKTVKEFERHKDHKLSESESSSESEDNGDEEQVFREDLDNEIGVDLGRHELGRFGTGQRRHSQLARSKSVPTIVRKPSLYDGFDRFGDDSESEDGESSGSGREYLFRSRGKKGNKDGQQDHRSTNGSGGLKRKPKSGAKHHKKYEYGFRDGQANGHRRGVVVSDEDEPFNWAVAHSNFHLNSMDLRQQREVLERNQVRKEAPVEPMSGYNYRGMLSD